MEQLTRYNLVAAFRDRAEAEAVLDHLHEAGVPHAELSLVASEQDVADLRPDETSDRQAAETAKTAVSGVVAGGAMGGTLGAIAGLATVGLPGIGVAVGAGALFAAAGGGVLATQSTEDPEAWKQRVGPVLGLVAEGHVLVGVHTDDEQRAASSDALLRESNPHRLESVDTSQEPYEGT